MLILPLETTREQRRTMGFETTSRAVPVRCTASTSVSFGAGRLSVTDAIHASQNRLGLESSTLDETSGSER